MHKIMVAGSGTEVGKTVVSAILVTLFQGNYWKPIQCGKEAESDSAVIKKLIDPNRHRVFSSRYSLQAPLSPHHATRLENKEIDPNSLHPPLSEHPLIIEGVGGVLVPLTDDFLSIDLFQGWKSKWVVVSKHYLGSINHTLLTLEALKKRNIPIAGLIFNGAPNPDSEKAILNISDVPFLGRLLPETHIDFLTIQKYAKQWHSLTSKL